MSKICKNCGIQIADGAGFCPNCGTAAPPDTPAGGSRFCPNCGVPVKNGAAFCDKCGTRLNSAQPPQQSAAPIQQQTYVQPAPPPPPVQPQYQQPYVQPVMQPAGGAAVKQKKSKYPLIITIIAIFLAITLVVVLVFNPFGKAKSPLGEQLEASFSNLCDMTKLGSESYAFARLLTEQLLETDLASADTDSVNSLFDQCLDAWKAVEEVSGKMISMSGELAADKGIQNAKVNTSKVSAVYAAPDLVDILFPFTIHASAADEDISTEVSAVASPAESVQQCSTLGMQILSDSQNGYTAVANLRTIYSGRTTPVQEWNSAVSTMAANFGMQFYVSGEITSGAFTTLPNGAHSVHTLSNAVKGGTVGVSNTDILIDVSENGGCMVFGTTCGLTINQDQFPDYTPSGDNRTISINTYPEEPDENGVTFHATSFFSWFRIDRVGGFTITRGNKGEGSVTDPPVVQNTGGNVDYTPPETNRGPISDFLPPISPTSIRDTSENITNGNNNSNSNSNNSGNTGGNESLPPITSDDITHITNELGAGVGPITVTLGWQTGDDLDLHMITPDGSRIYYRNKTAQGGTLDVDMNARESSINIPAVENIFFPDPENGHYKVYLRDFRDRTQNSPSHWMIKVKVGDAEHVFEGDIDNSGTEQFVFEFDYGGHGTESTLPPAPDSSTMGGTLVERGARTGKITLSTMWNRFDDVDLHCEAPGDAHIYYGNKTAGGGQLDVDANAGGQRILDPVENIYFENPRNGHYKVYLNQFADRSDDSASYLVRIDIDGEVREFSGTIDTTGTKVPIYEFDYNGAEETPAGEFGGHRYEYYPNADISWTQARAMCQSMGGHLVTITSAEEQAFIESTFPGTTGWIGAYGDESGWSWVTGEQWSYTHWSPENPDNAAGTEWFGHLWNSMQWNDLDNDDPRNAQFGFYCEYDEYGDGTGVVSGNNGNTGSTGNSGNTDVSNNSGRDFSDAIPISIGQTVDNKSIEEAGQEHVVYKFTTGEAGDYTVTMRHPQDYFGTADAIFVLSDSAQNRVSEEEWFRDEITRTYTLNGNSTYYLEVWDYVIFTVTYGASGGTADTSGSDGYWRLTKVSSYVYDIVNDTSGNYEGTSSHIVNDGMGETTDRSITETGSGLQFRYHDKYSYTSYGEVRSGTSTAITTSTLPKTAYAAGETAVLSFTNKASDTGEGSVESSISANFWHGPHTVDNSYFVNGRDFTDDSGEDDLDAYSPNNWRTDYPPEGTLTVKGDMPDKPDDLTDEDDTIINIRINSNSMIVCYTYEWTGGAMPADVGTASGYITSDSHITDGAVSGTYNGHTYTVIERELDPLAADEYCKSVGGYLATITSQGEQDFVAGLAAQVSSESFYIGGSDYGSEGNWYWMNGEAWNYTAWYPGGSVGDPEPNNGLGAGEDYVVMNKSRDYMWVDSYGGYSMTREYFICEWGDYDTTGSNPGGIQDERARQGAGDGKITISLMWDSKDDLDLHIFTPNGSELWWGNPNAQGGVFDIDANREGNIKQNPLENAYFASPVSGEYWVYVYNYEDRTPGQSTNWIVRVQVGDEEQIYSGTITNQEETIEVLGFSYTAGANSGSSSGGSSGNLLTNGSASDGMNGWQAPDGKWTTDSSYDGVSAYDSYYFCTKGFKADGGSSRMYQDADISGYVGRTATLSAMNRAYRSGHKDDSMLMIEFLNAGGSVISKASSEKDHGNSEWHRMSVSASVPSGAVKARVSLYTFYLEGSESDSYYDNVSLIVSG